MIDADPRTRDSIWQGVSLALSALADPRVLDAVSPGPGEAFDPETFIQNKGTLFLLATGAGAGDRKSTRLNSSHVAISYAVFCLKKKKRLMQSVVSGIV